MAVDYCVRLSGAVGIEKPVELDFEPLKPVLAKYLMALRAPWQELMANEHQKLTLEQLTQGAIALRDLGRLAVSCKYFFKERGALKDTFAFTLNRIRAVAAPALAVLQQWELAQGLTLSSPIQLREARTIVSWLEERDAGWTPLHRAAQSSLEDLDALCDAGANLDALTFPSTRGHFSASALTIACKSGRRHIAQSLLTRRANIHLGDPSPLLGAILGGYANANLVATLVDARATVNSNSNVVGMGRPLYIAARLGMTSTVQLLLRHKADINATSGLGRTALSGASSDSRAATVKLLLEERARVNLVDDDGNAPLHRAGSAEVAGLLLDKKATVDQVNRQGRTALSLAAEITNVAMVRLLLEWRASFLSADNEGLTPISYNKRSQWGSRDDKIAVYTLLRAGPEQSARVSQT
jgi:ankyrin repeat protein